MIKTPKAPAPRVVKPKEKPTKPINIVSFDEEPTEVKVIKMPKKNTVEPGPASPAPRTKSEKVSVHFCNCPYCKH